MPSFSWWGTRSTENSGSLTADDRLRAMHSGSVMKPRNEMPSDMSSPSYEGEMEDVTPGSLDSRASVFSSHPADLGNHSTCDRTSDAGGKRSAAQQLFHIWTEPGMSLWEDNGPLEPRWEGGRVKSISPEILFLWAYWAVTVKFSLMCVFRHISKAALIPTESFLSSAKHTKLCFKSE